MWGLPVVWLIACLCAQYRTRIFGRAAGCYILWQLLTWVGIKGLFLWQNMEAPLAPTLLPYFTHCPWLVSAMPGLFLCLYTCLMAGGDAIILLPRDRK